MIALFHTKIHNIFFIFLDVDFIIQSIIKFSIKNLLITYKMNTLSHPIEPQLTKIHKKDKQIKIYLSPFKISFKF